MVDGWLCTLKHYTQATHPCFTRDRALCCFTGVTCWEGRKGKGSTQSIVGVLNACCLVIRSLAAYNYAKLQRWLGVVSSTVWVAPRAEDLFLTWTFLVSQASQAETWEVTCSALLTFRKKNKLLKQFEVFCCCLFCSHRVTPLALNSLEMDLPLPQSTEIKGVHASLAMG